MEMYFHYDLKFYCMTYLKIWATDMEGSMFIQANAYLELPAERKGCVTQAKSDSALSKASSHVGCWGLSALCGYVYVGQLPVLYCSH